MILHRQASAARGGASRAKVLLCVDDSQLALQVCAQVLSLHGYEVIAADNAEQALDALDGHPIDAIVTDYQMAGMNGGQLAAQVKSSAHPIPVLLYTGCADIPACAIACVDAIIPKGRTVGALLTAVDSCFALTPETSAHEVLELAQ